MTEHFLIAYFSGSGNTRKVSQFIHQETGGTLYEIEPELPYPNAYQAVVDQAKREIQGGHKPKLKSSLGQVDAFDLIFMRLVSLICSQLSFGLGLLCLV